MSVDGIGVAVRFADRPHGGSIRLARGVGILTLPPVLPAFVQDDERFRLTAELFIVYCLATRSLGLDLAWASIYAR